MSKYEPVMSGTYACGTKRFSFVDEGRPEVLGKGGYRKVAVRLYYPCDHEAVELLPQGRLMSVHTADEVKKQYHFDIDKIGNYADFYENVEVADGKFPLIVYSHGYGSYAEDNNHLCMDLASHGYIVMSIAHTHEALGIDFSDGSYAMFDGTTIKRMYGGNLVKYLFDVMKLERAKGSDEVKYYKFRTFADGMDFAKQRIVQWGHDTISAVNKLKDMDIAEHIDWDKGIGCTGHSFGGATAYWLCLYHPDEYVCGINIDGALFGEHASLPMKRPFCQISCEANVNTQTRVFVDNEAPAYSLVFRRNTHAGFTDLKFIDKMKGQTGKMDPQIMYENLFGAHIGMFDRYLKGVEDMVVGRPSEFIIYREEQK